MTSRIKEILHSTRHTLTDIINNTLHGRPDVIIIGETHTDEGHGTDQARMIKRHRPEYVLSEGFGNLNPEDTKKFIDRYKTVTLSDLSGVSGIDLEQMGIGKGTLQAIRGKVTQYVEDTLNIYRTELSDKEAKKLAKEDAKREGIVPRNYKQLVNTPFYEFLPEVLNIVRDQVSDKRDAETYQDNFALFRKLGTIREYLLTFEIKSQNNKWENIRGSERVYHAIAQSGIELAGCDIQKELPELNMENLSEYIVALIDYIAEKNPIREQEMGQRIAQFVRQRQTISPVVAIVGRNHTKEDSGIYSVLEKAGINYRIIRQKSFDNDNIKSITYPFQLGMKQ